MRSRLVALGLAAIAAVALTSMALAASSVVKVRQDPKLGSILVNTSGRTLYHLNGETTHHFLCTAAASCTQMWPPLTTSKKLPKNHMKGLSTVKRPDTHKLQLVYNGKPLYRFSGDHKAGDTNGQGFAGVWFAVAGPKKKSSAQQQPAQQPPSSGYPPY
jgi:predicted lipoprotein with Yx(FWY)xxD motif